MVLCIDRLDVILFERKEGGKYEFTGIVSLDAGDQLALSNATARNTVNIDLYTT
jgi:hypothetical protein